MLQHLVSNRFPFVVPANAKTYKSKNANWLGSLPNS